MSSFLDKNGLSHLWSGLKTKLNAKQDKLTSQTAYSNKGSATKVPKITTNSLGQVTNITEVTITQPDISGKLDKTSVKGTQTTSATDTYNCNYVNSMITPSGVYVNGVAIIYDDGN